VVGLSGHRFVRRTRVTRSQRGGSEELRVLVQVAEDKRGAGLDPLAEELIVATPDGEMVGEYTLAGEGNDPRRYVWPAPWVPWAMIGAFVALIALIVLLG
jgi:hypothetical protein